MTPPRSSTLRSRYLRRPAFALGLALAAITLAPALRAQTAADLPKKEVSEKTSSGFAKLKPLVDAKDYAGALALVDQTLAAAAPSSFDVYVLSQIKAQILLSQNQLAAAVAPLETALRLGEGNTNFFDATSNLDQINLLAQLYYQVAAEDKDPAKQRAGYEKALAFMDRWLDRTPQPTADGHAFCASLLYNLGTLDSTKPDATRLKAAIGHAQDARLLALKPSSQVQFILIACHLQLGDNARAAELLELAASSDPKSSNTWSQLQSLYLTSAAETKDADLAYRLNLRALSTLERAQAQGFLNSPKDHYTRVAILFNIQQFSRAAELLEKGLADGTLENAKRNWELLASAYQQTSRDEKALDALDRAVRQFPADGPLEFSLAQFLYNTGKVNEAYRRSAAALAKPGIDKPGQVQIYLAYLAYELQRYDEAHRWIDAARAAGDVPAATIDPLAKAIADAVKERAAIKPNAS
jgi:Tfp pilus assembly protein PilF